MKHTRVHLLWRDRGVSRDFKTGVSLHSHTMHSRENLAFIPVYAQYIPLLAWELDRLASHIAAAEALLAEGVAIGRRFDFLVQEFNREANTLCSKSSSTALTAVGLKLKAAIEQMREQVQNIE